ncbi:hypothetical protein SUGI_0889810 [Cryptomeria japonica]|nr:hypothetical protein SUGI_0889810 [Cryptomeria japonica]
MMTEDKKMWDSCMTKLEGRVAGLQNELNERQVFSQGHEELCTKLRKEKNDLENKLKEFTDINKKLQNKITEDGFYFDSCKLELKGRVAQLQDELNETRKLWQKHEKLSTELRQENIELGNKLKESNDESIELKEKLIEDRCLWNLSKAELEGTVVGLQNELNETRLKHEEFYIQLTDEKKHLEEKLKEFDDETEELKAKMTEHRCLWESSKAELEGTVAGLENELNETRLKHDEYCIHLGHEKEHLEENSKGYEYKNEELHLKMTENPSFWNTFKADLEETIAELQNELNESRILCQKNQVSCNVISKENIELENKLKESINETKELKEKIAEDMQSKIVKLQDKVDFAVNERNVLEQKYEELEYKLKELNDINKELQNKIIEDGFLFNACKVENIAEIFVDTNVRERTTHDASGSVLQDSMLKWQGTHGIWDHCFIDMCSACQLAMQLLSFIYHSRLVLFKNLNGKFDPPFLAKPILPTSTPESEFSWMRALYGEDFILIRKIREFILNMA